MSSDLDIPPLPRPPDSLRSLSRRLSEALNGGGPFDRAGHEARRIVREAAKEMLKIAADADGTWQPGYIGREVCIPDAERNSASLPVLPFARRPAFVLVKGGRSTAPPVQSGSP